MTPPIHSSSHAEGEQYRRLVESNGDEYDPAAAFFGAPALLS